jgi:hypothetical protein
MGKIQGNRYIPERGEQLYHGSPHLFDRFDMSKIGTGDGLSKYGHGLYFAFDDEIASYYANMLTIGNLKGKGFNLYEVTIERNANIMKWEGYMDEPTFKCILRGLEDNGFGEDADELRIESEDYGVDTYTFRNIYEYLLAVMDEERLVSEFLVSKCDIDGAYVEKAPMGNFGSVEIVAVYNDDILNITNKYRINEASTA